MSGESIAAIIVAATGLVAGLFGAYRASRSDGNTQKIANDAAVVTNFQTLYDEIREEIRRIRDEQREERKQWAEERERFQLKIEELTKQVGSRDIEIAKLQGQVEALEKELASYKTTHREIHITESPETREQAEKRNK